MKTALKIFGLFVLIVCLLSITVKDRTLFAHIYRTISPATVTVQDATENFFSRSLNKTKGYSRRLFHNSVPKVNDSVKSKLAATKRKIGEPEERIEEEEKEELDELIKSHR